MAAASLLIVRSRGEGNDTPQHAILAFRPTDAERLVLDLQQAKSCFAPGFDRGANSGYALGSYFACKYRPWWCDGVPADDSDDDDDAVIVEEKVDWTLRHWAIYDDDSDGLLRGDIDDYLDHIKSIASGTCRGHRKGRAYLDEHPELRDKILALTPNDFSAAKRRKRTIK